MMLRRTLFVLGAAAFLVDAVGGPLAAQSGGAGAASEIYSTAQLDALLAPIALYPDELLTQTLMASTFPLQVIDAHRWVEDPANKALQGDALVAALADKAWDPSVKSLVPFPQVLAMMNGKLDWIEDVGYAMTRQERDVWAAVQRLRRQAQASGNLKSNEQQIVSADSQTIIIAPAQPTVVYVPTYNPTLVYGAWPYPAYPPVYVPYPPGYALATGVAVGLAFGAAVAVNRGLWGWATPHWGYGNVNVNVNRYNNINVNRPPINNSNWRPGGPGSGYRPGTGNRPPGGPVGSPGRPAHQPAHRPAHQPAHQPAHRPVHGTGGRAPSTLPAGGAGHGGLGSGHGAGGRAPSTLPAGGGGHGGSGSANARPRPNAAGRGRGRRGR
jgi:hypothetical protein